MNNMNSLEEHWHEWAEACLPECCSDIQRQETKRAFYSGAVAILQVVEQVGNDDIDEETGTKVVSKIYREIDEFRKQVERGVA